MRKLIATIIPFIAFLGFTPSAFAINICPTNDSFGSLCNVQIGTVVVGIINLIFILAVIVALLYLIWGGFKWLTSGGDKTGVQAAREHVVAAVVGLVIIFLSYFILNIIIGFFIPGFSLSGFKLPTIINPSSVGGGGTTSSGPGSTFCETHQWLKRCMP